MRLLVDHGTHANLGDLAMLENVVARLALRLPGVELHVVGRAAIPSALWAGVGVHRHPPYRVAVRGTRLAAHLPWAWRYAEAWSRVLHRAAMGRLRAAGQVGNLRLVPDAAAPGRTSLADYCRPFDGLHVVGGGNLTDAFPEELFNRACLVAAFTEQGKNVVLTGQQIGPFHGPRSAAALAAVLDRASFVGVRDPLDSFAFCRASLAARHGVTGDDALSGPPLPGQADVAAQLSRHGLAGTPFIVSNLRRGAYAGSDRRSAEHLAALLDEIARRAALRVLFVPTALGERDSDIESARSVARLVRAASVTVLDAAGLTPGMVRAVVAAAHGVVAVSHHVCTFGLAQGVPAVCLFGGEYYAQKARALAAFWQDDRFALSRAVLDPGRAAAHVLGVFQDPGVRARLAVRAARAVRRWEDVFDAEVRRAWAPA